MSPTSISVRHLAEVRITSHFAVTSYTLTLQVAETGWLPLVTTVTYGYSWLHMVTYGYIWLQMVTSDRLDPSGRDPLRARCS